MTRAQTPDAGLTLIELVVAMAVFALVAVMGLQSLNVMLRNRDHLASLEAETSALTQGVAVLRNDLSAIVPLLFYPPERAAPQSAVSLNQAGTAFGMSVGGQPELGAGARLGAMHRVIWRFDRENGALSRQAWRSLTPLDAGAALPEVVVLKDVTGFDVRSFWADVGWVDGLNNPKATPFEISEADGDETGGAPEVYSDTLPLALEVTLNHATLGPLPLIETLK